VIVDIASPQNFLKRAFGRNQIGVKVLGFRFWVLGFGEIRNLTTPNVINLNMVL